MTPAAGTPGPTNLQEIRTELSALRRRIAELERAKRQLAAREPAPTPLGTLDAVGRIEDLGQSIHAFVRRVGAILQAEKCVIMLRDPEANELIAKPPALGLSAEEIAAIHVPSPLGISWQVYDSKQPVICHDCATDERALQEGLNKVGARDSLCVPLMFERRNESEWVVESIPIGVIHVFNKRFERRFTEEDLSLLNVLGRNAAALISTMPAFQAAQSEKINLEFTLESMTIGMLVISRDGRVQVLNAAAGDILHLDPEDAVGRPFTEVIRHDEVRAALASAEGAGGEVGHEFTIGDHIYQALMAVVHDELGVSRGVLCALYDVTELRNVERMKSDFVSTVSHELRTPLTAIKGFVRTLLDDQSGDYYDQQTRMEFYAIIDSECDRLVRLISDLLSVSSIERGLPLIMNWDTVQVPELIENCVAFQRGYTDKHELVVDIPAELPPITADRDKLDQVLTNLLSNAVKYSPDGGTVTVQAIDEGETLRIAVSDQGIGIPPEHLDKVFNRFHRVNSGDSQHLGGTGIGLFLTRNLVEAHGGIVWIDSVLGKGATFYFTLPKHQPVEDQAPAESAGAQR